jgi:hypothetical protein
MRVVCSGCKQPVEMEAPKALPKKVRSRMRRLAKRRAAELRAES